jgi:hypothetical protein
MLLARLADKPLILQETVVKICDKKDKRTNVHAIQLTTAPPTWPETMPDKFMRKK